MNLFDVDPAKYELQFRSQKVGIKRHVVDGKIDLSWAIAVSAGEVVDQTLRGRKIERLLEFDRGLLQLLRLLKIKYTNFAIQN